MAGFCAWTAVSLLGMPSWPLRLVDLADALGPAALRSGLPSRTELGALAGRCQVASGFGREAVLCPFDQPLAAFGALLPLAAVANEDKRFLVHAGTDFYRLPAAAWSTLRGRPSGASTITQQTARVLFLRPGDDSLSRKLKEMVLARRLEGVWNKEETLTAYLNTVPLGRGIFGFDRGARYFIGRPASELSLADALILVGKAPAPERRDPEGSRSSSDLEAWATAAETAETAEVVG